MEEKKLTDEIVDILTEFDEYGFQATVTMPNAEEYAKDWKNRLIDLFHRLQSENAKQKAEIERIHKAIDEEFVSLKAVRAAENSPKAMKMLVESIGCVQKDTAKEITSKVVDLSVICGDDFRLFLDNFELWVKERYGVEVE